MTTEIGTSKVFRYNLSFYYQSTIIYFVAFLLYAIVKGEFFEGSFRLITKDPVIYFFILVVFISIASLLYNLYLNRHIEITDTQIIFKKGSKIKAVDIENIISINFARERSRIKKNRLRIVRIRTNKKRLPVIIIPYDYEDRAALVESIKEIRNKVMNRDDNV